MTAKRPVFLFDLGGVLVDLGEPADVMSLDMSNDEFWAIWLGSPVVHAYEKGLLSTSQFYSEFSGQVGIAEANDFRERFAKWQLKPFGNIEEMLSQLMVSHTVALLSNTNELHWQSVVDQTKIFSRFSKLFLSFEMGCMKPSEEIFERVVVELQRDAADIIFLDDSHKNVESAIKVGLTAHQVAGGDRATSILAAYATVDSQ